MPVPGGAHAACEAGTLLLVRAAASCAPALCVGSFMSHQAANTLSLFCPLCAPAACGLAVYTPVRHLATASDITLDRSQRDYADDLASGPRLLNRAKQYGAHPHAGHALAHGMAACNGRALRSASQAAGCCVCIGRRCHTPCAVCSPGLCVCAHPSPTLMRAEGGVLGLAASIKSWPQVWSLPNYVPQEHFHLGRWPAPRPFTVPQPDN